MNRHTPIDPRTRQGLSIDCGPLYRSDDEDTQAAEILAAFENLPLPNPETEARRLAASAELAAIVSAATSAQDWPPASPSPATFPAQPPPEFALRLRKAGLAVVVALLLAAAVLACIFVMRSS